MKTYYIDFDGVILDTEQLVIKEIKQEIHDDGLNEIFEEIDWNNLFKNAKVINNSLNIIQERQYNNNLKILTKIKHLNEGVAKIQFLRLNKIYCPIILVPINTPKSIVIMPTINDILIDDDLINIKEWEQGGGIAIHYHKSSLIDIFNNNIK